MQVLTRPPRGFTLLEAIVAIVITGIIAGMVAVFIARPIEGYVDSVRRAGLTDVADLALKRMALDIRTAVPNSVRVTGGGMYIEFIPARSGGRYCSDMETGCNALSLSTSNDSFDIISPDVSAVTGDQLIIYNTSQAGLNAYDCSGACNRRGMSGLPASLSAVTSLTVSGSAFAYDSPSRRFQLVPSTGPVTYACENVGTAGTLKRYTGYGYQAAQPTAGLGTGALLADYVSACNFSYSAASARNGLLALSLTITRDGESVTLHHEIHVDNLP